MTRLMTAAIAASFLTGLWLVGAQAGEPKENCPPPPPGEGARFFGPPGFGPGGPGGPGPHRMMSPLADADLDKDGRITHAEIDQATRARFDAADADHNGTLDAKEFESARPKPPADMPKPPDGAMRRGPFGGPEQAFKRLDWNGDGKLSLDEFAAPVRTMASHTDRDADGAISEDELKGPPGPPGPPPPRPE